MSLNTVLIVEDEYLIADDVARAFLMIGCANVEMAASVPDALSSIRRHRPDGVVLDLNLKNRMAFSVADSLLRKQIPFLFMTGHDPSVVPTRFKDVTRCQKPVAPLHVAKTLLRVAWTVDPGILPPASRVDTMAANWMIPAARRW